MPSNNIVFSGVHPSFASANCTHFLCQIVNNFCKFYQIQIVFKISPHCSGDLCIVTGNLEDEFIDYYPSNIFEILYINIIVPVKRKIHKSEYFLKPFDSTIWILIGINLFYVASALNLISLIRGQKIDFSKNFLKSLNLFMSSGSKLNNSFILF